MRTTKHHHAAGSLDSSASTVGVAGIGLGYWGPNLLRVLADNPDPKVHLICDLDRQRLQPYRRR